MLAQAMKLACNLLSGIVILPVALYLTIVFTPDLTNAAHRVDDTPCGHILRKGCSFCHDPAVARR